MNEVPGFRNPKSAWFADDRYRRDDRVNTAKDAGKGTGIGAAIGGIGGLLTVLG